jgi:hypothetical protein
MFNNVSVKIVPFMRYVEKYCRDGQTTDDNIKLSMRFAFWIIKLQTHPENMQYFFLSHGNNSYTNTHKFDIILMLAVLLVLLMANFGVIFL